MIDTVGKLRAALADVGDDEPIGLVQKYGRTEAQDEYDDYEGMPTGRLLDLHVRIIPGQVEVDGW